MFTGIQTYWQAWNGGGGVMVCRGSGGWMRQPPLKMMTHTGVSRGIPSYDCSPGRSALFFASARVIRSANSTSGGWRLPGGCPQKDARCNDRLHPVSNGQPGGIRPKRAFWNRRPEAQFFCSLLDAHCSREDQNHQTNQLAQGNRYGFSLHHFPVPPSLAAP